LRPVDVPESMRPRDRKLPAGLDWFSILHEPAGSIKHLQRINMSPI
jgi:hypothetical protein